MNALAPRTGRRSFVMLEVIVALTILGVSSMAFMRSFTQTLDAARRMENLTQGILLAQHVLGEFEVSEPWRGSHEGGFGEAYRNFWWQAEIFYEDPDYGREVEDDNVDQWYQLRYVDLTINFQDEIRDPYTVVRVPTAIIGFEKFSLNTKKSYNIH